MSRGMLLADASPGCRFEVVSFFLVEGYEL